MKTPSAGFSLIELLMGAAIVAAVSIYAGRAMINLNKGLSTVDIASQRDLLFSYYSELLRNTKYTERSESNATYNPSLVAFRNRTAGYALSGPYALLSPTGAVVIPAAGLYLDVNGRIASAGNYYWLVTATWDGTATGSYRTNLTIRQNPSPNVKNALATRTKSTYDRSLLDCFGIQAAPGIGRQNASTWYLGYGPNLPSTQRPMDFIGGVLPNLTTVDVTCPTGSVIVSVATTGACGGSRSSSAITGTTTGRCQNFAYAGNATYCTLLSQRSTICRAVCCVFPVSGS